MGSHSPNGHYGVSTNGTESYVGIDLLQKSKADWNDNPEQRTFIRNVRAALTAAPVQACGGSQTTVVTNPSPLSSTPVPSVPSAPMASGGTS